MRKGLITAGLLAGALAASPWARADDVQKAKDDAQQDLNKAKAEASRDEQKARIEARQKIQKADVDASKKVQRAEDRAREKVSDARKKGEHRDIDALVTTKKDQRHSMADRRRNVFEGKSNYDVKGTIEKVAGHSITVHRDDLPSVTLSTEPSTHITVNGNDKASTAQLRPGQDVSASFNLEGNKPVAVEIEANTHH